MGYEYSIPVLDKLNETERNTPFSLGVDGGEGVYGVYIAHNGDFILSYENYGNSKKSCKSIDVRFRPEDAQHLIKGLIFQSAKGLGRTSANQLFEILNYRYSSEFDEDQKL